MNLASISSLNEQTSLFSDETSFFGLNYLEFLEKKGDPLCLARISFYRFVTTSALVNLVELKLLLDQQPLSLLIEQIAISVAVFISLISLEKRLQRNARAHR